jgi:hypothetical protein
VRCKTVPAQRLIVEKQDFSLIALEIRRLG